MAVKKIIYNIYFEVYICYGIKNFLQIKRILASCRNIFIVLPHLHSCQHSCPRKINFLSGSDRQLKKLQMETESKKYFQYGQQFQKLKLKYNVFYKYYK